MFKINLLSAYNRRTYGIALGSLIKVLVVLLVVGGIGWLVYRGVTSISRAVDKSPYPNDPVETVTTFFKALQKKEYQQCYGLLSSKRLAATVIGRQTREKYFNHFNRIRVYLVERSGANFAEGMTVLGNGDQVGFPHDIVLTVALGGGSGPDGKRYYSIDEINEFPIDIAPGIGVEQYNRQLNRMVEGMEGSAGGEPSDDASEIIRDRSGESRPERESRLIAAFKQGRQLDTRHTVLEWIIREFDRDPLAQKFLGEVAGSEYELPQLRQLARQGLDNQQ